MPNQEVLETILTSPMSRGQYSICKLRDCWLDEDECSIRHTNRWQAEDWGII